MPSIINATTTNGVAISPDNSGSLQLATNNGTTAVTIDTSQNVGIGTASPTSKLDVFGSGLLYSFLRNPTVTTLMAVDTSAAYFGSGTNHPVVFQTNNSERMRIDSSGNVGIGTSSPETKLHVTQSNDALPALQLRHGDGDFILMEEGGGTDLFKFTRVAATNDLQINNVTANNIRFATNNTERMRITSTGALFVGKTTGAFTNTAGFEADNTGAVYVTRTGQTPLHINRLTNDGDLIWLGQDGNLEGTISVSGTTVSYNGGHLSRYAQTIGAKDEALVKGTVLSNLDEMNEYVNAEGNPVDNEQLNKVKVSDVEGDINVAGVFVNWSHDEAHNVDEINMAMTGDMIIRIAQDVVVQKGDLLMSAGDGTAKPQGDDIVRSKTIAKVTSNHVTCTYEDGSYCVPCVLMAC